MRPRQPSPRPPRPLDETRLRELAVAYVGRFATTRARLSAYLGRKLRERGWDGAGDPAVDRLAERLASLGYVDDAGYALAKARALGQRGFGPRRLSMALRQAGVSEEDGRAAHDESARHAVTAALRFAQRRRIGPFAAEPPDPKLRDRALAAMLRAGHDFDLARRILALAPGSVADPAMPPAELFDGRG